MMILYWIYEIDVHSPDFILDLSTSLDLWNPGVWIRIEFTDPDPAFLLNPDPDPS
jgi:hypothetical protein